jgi:hypothetical protein
MHAKNRRRRVLASCVAKDSVICEVSWAQQPTTLAGSNGFADVPIGLAHKKNPLAVAQGQQNFGLRLSQHPTFTCLGIALPMVGPKEQMDALNRPGDMLEAKRLASEVLAMRNSAYAHNFAPSIGADSSENACSGASLRGSHNGAVRGLYANSHASFFASH